MLIFKANANCRLIFFPRFLSTFRHVMWHKFNLFRIFFFLSKAVAAIANRPFHFDAKSVVWVLSYISEYIRFISWRGDRRARWVEIVNTITRTHPQNTILINFSANVRSSCLSIKWLRRLKTHVHFLFYFINFLSQFYFRSSSRDFLSCRWRKQHGAACELSWFVWYD